MFCTILAQFFQIYFDWSYFYFISSSSPKGFSNEESTIGLISDDDELEDRSFDRSVMNNQDFPLSSSFNNMYKKNGLHIEEGQIGR